MSASEGPLEFEVRPGGPMTGSDQSISSNARVVASIKPEAWLWHNGSELEPIGYVRSNGAGEIVFRQAGHSTNNDSLVADGWLPVYGSPSEQQRPAEYTSARKDASQATGQPRASRTMTDDDIRTAAWYLDEIAASPHVKSQPWYMRLQADAEAIRNAAQTRGTT